MNARRTEMEMNLSNSRLIDVTGSELTSVEGGKYAIRGEWANAGFGIGGTIGYLGFGPLGGVVGGAIGTAIGAIIDWIF
jgi:hypothetical protein